MAKPASLGKSLPMSHKYTVKLSKSEWEELIRLMMQFDEILNDKLWWFTIREVCAGVFRRMVTRASLKPSNNSLTISRGQAAAMILFLQKAECAGIIARQGLYSENVANRLLIDLAVHFA